MSVAASLSVVASLPVPVGASVGSILAASYSAAKVVSPIMTVSAAMFQPLSTSPLR